ncbi:non-specific serine/threonine protein kinase [Ranunculus cassubicifolius]
MSRGSVLLRLLWILILLNTCFASIRSVGQIKPGFRASQMLYIDNSGLFLVSNNSNFAFGFTASDDKTLFLLSIIHLSSSKVVWSANRDTYVINSDFFVFENNGNARLEGEKGTIWSTDSIGKGVTALELQDSGNLVLRGKDRSIVWQSFSNPTDTLLSGQEFVEGTKLVSNPNKNNFSYHLEIASGDMILYVNYPTPQPYWSMSKEPLKIQNKVSGSVLSVSMVNNAWDFYDRSKGLLWQFIFSTNTDPNATWSAVLDNTGVISFYNLESGKTTSAESIQIPKESCSRPEFCGSYYVCSDPSRCQCSSVLASRPNCSPGFTTSCNRSNAPMELIDAGAGNNYFALDFVSPFSKSGDLNGCKDACLKNCSCVVLFFDASSRKCYLFDHVGSFQQSTKNSAGLVSYIKVSGNGDRGQNSDGKGGGGGSQKNTKIVIIIVVMTILVIAGLIYFAFRYNKKKKMLPESPHESEEDNFLESLTGMPLRFTYKELEEATNNFSLKLGQGGFGSVYQGKLKDGTEIAVKQLEGIGQGKKEFRAEVSIIGSIHHTHLVRLRGFCVEGSHRLLAYEYMANNSLDKWIFKKNEGGKLDWATRYNIAVGTAKGLAYLHEDCDVKIVHCDIKPENVLLDEHFRAKVSDFGLAKLMNREQSNVFTTMRGTRGYLAPEWITNYAISEKSDVYSFGMVLLELIGGRKNFDQSETSEKAHFPTFTLKMAEEKKLHEVIDPSIKVEDDDDTVIIAIQVALWCIQEEMHMRPSMSRVVQMLEGISPVPEPPTSSHLGSRLYSSFFKSISEDGTTSSGMSDFNSGANLSAMRLSGPR